MNVTKTVRTTMIKAFANFASQHGVEPKDIKFFIVPKGKDNFDGRVKINYCYMVENKMMKNDDGSTLFIPFKKILGKKADVTGMGMITANFLKDYFGQEAKEIEVELTQLRLMLMPHSEDSEKVRIFLYNNTSIHAELTLEGVFGDEEENRE